MTNRAFPVVSCSTRIEYRSPDGHVWVLLFDAASRDQIISARTIVAGWASRSDLSLTWTDAYRICEMISAVE